MAEFMPGLELAGLYYEEAVKPILTRFPNWPPNGNASVRKSRSLVAPASSVTRSALPSSQRAWCVT